MTEKSIYSSAYRKLTSLLRSTRKKAGISQASLAERLGGDQSFVSKVERNERRIDLEEVRRICEVLEVPFLDFVTDWEASIGPVDEITDAHGLVRDAPANNGGWRMSEWRKLLEWLVKTGNLSYRDITVLALEHLYLSHADATPSASTPSKGAARKRDSTALSAEAALMWILFTKHPKSYPKYKALCQEYGLVLDEAQYEEAWATKKRLKLPS